MKTKKMGGKELVDAIDGMFAYHVGATDSGISDEMLKARVKKQLSETNPTIRRAFFERCSAIYDQGDRAAFLRWAHIDLGVDTGIEI